MEKVTFTYKSVLESEGRAYSDVKKVLEKVDLPAKSFHRIMLAISEAFTNALVHGNDYDPEKKIEICISVNDRAVIADVIDEGLCDMTAFSKRKSANSTDEGGRGIDLIESMADEIEVHKNDRTGGLQVSMKFYRSGFKDIKDNHAYRR